MSPQTKTARHTRAALRLSLPTLKDAYAPAHHEVPDDDDGLDGHLGPRAPEQDTAHKVRQPAQVERGDDAHELEAQVQQSAPLPVTEPKAETAELRNRPRDTNSSLP